MVPSWGTPKVAKKWCHSGHPFSGHQSRIGALWVSKSVSKTGPKSDPQTWPGCPFLATSEKADVSISVRFRWGAKKITHFSEKKRTHFSKNRVQFWSQYPRHNEIWVSKKVCQKTGFWAKRVTPKMTTFWPKSGHFWHFRKAKKEWKTEYGFSKPVSTRFLSDFRPKKVILDTILDTPNPLPQYSMPNTIGIVPIPPNRVSRMGPESAPKVTPWCHKSDHFLVTFWTPYYRREYHVWCQ